MKKMKIAVPVNKGNVNEHFGHSEDFAVFTISTENTIESMMPVTSEGCGCRSGIAEILAEQGVSVLLAGNIGAGAITHLNESGIEVVRGCNGQVDNVVVEFLKGTIRDNEQICTHHEGCHDHRANEAEH
jgi:predicted Fe-Mo cluster-binding NifX family protein